MTTRKEPDPEGDAADAAKLEDADDTCASCGQPLYGLDGCSTPGCEGNPETDDEDDLPEGLLGEDDEDWDDDA